MARHKDAISFDHCCSKMDGLSWSNQTGCYSCMQLKDISGKLTVTVRFVDVFISADTINKTYSKCKWCWNWIIWWFNMLFMVRPSLQVIWWSILFFSRKLHLSIGHGFRRKLVSSITCSIDNQCIFRLFSYILLVTLCTF